MPSWGPVSGRLVELGGRPLFSVEGVAYSWADVLAAASARGSLDQLQSRSRQGVALVRRSEALGDHLDADTVRTAAQDFRYERGLLSAEELEAWLSKWSLTVEEWTSFLKRSLLLDQRAEETPAPETGLTLEDEALEVGEYVDAVCSGFLEREALRLADDAALASLESVDLAEDGSARVGRIVAAAAAARAGAASAPDLDREIAKQGLDWTRLEMDVLELPLLDAAREAAMCVLDDGRDIADVALDAGAPLRHTSVYVADLEPELSPSLIAAQPGELVGPVERDGAFVLVSIDERTPPATDDPELRRRARAALVDRAIKRATAGRVEWHEPV